jgi:PAS domain S-box-containing protein
MDLIVSFSGTAIRDADGTITLALLTLHDITEERRAQESLRESESQFREIFEQTPIGMTLNDLNGRYLHANPAYCRLVGRTRESLLEPSIDSRDLIYPEDRPKVMKHQAQVLAGEIPAYFIEKRYVRPDGSLVWVRFRHGAAGRPGQTDPICATGRRYQRPKEGRRRTRSSAR